MIAGVFLISSSIPSSALLALSYSGFTWLQKSRRVLFPKIWLAMSSWADHAQLKAMLSTAQRYNCYLGLSYFSPYILQEMWSCSSHEDGPEKLELENNPMCCSHVINGLKLEARPLFYCFPIFTFILQHELSVLVISVDPQGCGQLHFQPPLQLSEPR